MRQDLTDITVVMDRSGSMSNIRKDAEGGLNQFVKDQQAKEGDAVFTLVQFDTEYEFVHKAVPIAQVPKLSLIPRGSTALLDALGRAIVETGERIAAMPEDQRPGLVVFVILTDGEENSSREFKLAQIAEMTKHQTEVYKWQFLYLGANQDAFKEAGGLGINLAGAANYKPRNVRKALFAASSNLARMRSCAVTGQIINSAYTQEERELMESEES